MNIHNWPQESGNNKEIKLQTTKTPRTIISVDAGVRDAAGQGAEAIRHRMTMN